MEKPALYQPTRPQRRDYTFELIGVREPYLTNGNCIEAASREIVSELSLTILVITTLVPGDLSGYIFNAPIEGQSQLTVISFPSYEFIEASFRTGLRGIPHLQRFGSLFLDKFHADEVDLRQNNRSQLLVARNPASGIIIRPRPPEAAYLRSTQLSA
jgi:hypothetical protein